MHESDSSDIQKYYEIFQKYKWHGLIPACLLTLLLVAGSFFLPEVYQSTCVIEVERGAIENPLKTRGERMSDMREHLASVSEHALRWSILAQVVEKIGAEKVITNSDVYGLSRLKKAFRIGGPSDQTTQDANAQTEHVIKLLKKVIKFRQRQPNFLVLEYKGTSPDVTANVLNTLVAVILEEKTREELSEVGKNYEFIRTELENYRQKLEVAEVQLKQFKEQHISELPNNMNVNLTQLSNDKSELHAAEFEMKELTTRIQYVDDALKKQEELIISEIRRETDPMIIVLNERIVDMEIELTRLRTNYTEIHPRVAELKGQLEDLKKQRDKIKVATVDSETSMLNPVYQQLVQDKQNTEMQIEVLKNRIANLEERIQENEKKVRSMPSQEQELITLTRNYDVTANIYNMFLQKLEEARLQEKLAAQAKDKESFMIVEYPRATFTPVAPQKKKIFLTIAIVGIATCVGIIVLLNSLDDTFNDVEEVKKLLGKPLLGTLPLLGEKTTKVKSLSSQIRVLTRIKNYSSNQ